MYIFDTNNPYFLELRFALGLHTLHGRLTRVHLVIFHMADFYSTIYTFALFLLKILQKLRTSLKIQQITE